ncbi:NUDIX hydrolase [Paraburkholderia sediminicola]|uniref:NUDIX hydrolase n=1 Tax=Paraburkholderia sediminicola TaxID=458836 RepID=UPI0038BD7111
MKSNSLLQFVELVLAVAQAGLTFSRDRFDIERFDGLRKATASFLAENAELDPKEVQQWIALDQGYPTPKLDVRAVILNNEGQLLLVQESVDALWTLPGGWCDIGESPADAACREVREEAGLEVEPVRLLALFDKHKHPHPPQLPHAYKAFFQCTVIGGSLIQSSAETSGAGYFGLAQLPALSLDRVLPSQIQTLCARILAGQTDTLFD